MDTLSVLSPSRAGRSELTAPALCRGRRKSATAASASLRTRTKRASSSSSGRVDGARAALCRAGSGGRPVIVVCSSLRKDGDGDSAVLMNCPGRTSCKPYTPSAGENSLSSQKAVLIPAAPKGGGHASRRRRPGNAGRPSAACGTARLTRLTEGGMLSWASAGW